MLFRLSPEAAAVILGAVTIISWASFNVAAKAGVDAGMTPSALTFLRFATPGVIAAPLWVWARRRARAPRPPGSRLLRLALLGGPIFGLTAVSGYLYAPLSHGLLFAPVTVFVAAALLGALLLNERVAPRRLVGALIMVIGLAVLVGFDLSGLGQDWLIGVAFFVTAGALWGAYTVLLRRWRIPLVDGALGVASCAALIAVIALGPSAIAALSQAPPQAIAVQILMQGVVGGVISVVALIAALRHLSAQTAALLPTFTPAAALLIAWSVLGQTPSAGEIAGALAIFVGFAIASGPLRREPNATKAD